VGEVADEIDCVCKAVPTLAVASSSPSVIISLPVEFAREIETRPDSFFKPKSSLADCAKSFSTLGVRKIRRFLLLRDPLHGAERAVWGGESDFTGVLGEEEHPGDEVEGCEGTRALYGNEMCSLVSHRIVSRESSRIIDKIGRRGGGAEQTGCGVLSVDDDDVGEDLGLADALRFFLASCVPFLTPRSNFASPCSQTSGWSQWTL